MILPVSQAANTVQGLYTAIVKIPISSVSGKIVPMYIPNNKVIFTTPHIPEPDKFRPSDNSPRPPSVSIRSFSPSAVPSWKNAGDAPALDPINKLH